MLTLLIETSTERGVVFIFEDGKLVFEGILPPGLHNSTDLLPAIERGLKHLNIGVKDIGLIGTGVGPGSYTGLRVGAMAAKTLSYANKIPLVGLCSLDCFTSSTEQTFGVIIDAKIGGAYLKVPGKEALVCALDEVSGNLGNIRHLVTPNAKMLSQKLAHIEGLSWEEVHPNAQTMYDIAVRRHQEGLYSIDGSVDLLYMRKTQAEIERENLQR